jgi:hypothetical protein
MRYVDEFRDKTLVNGILNEIRRSISQKWVIMEICGGQTHTILRFGLDQILPPEVELVHGPGCPVCVTSLELIDKALAIAAKPDVIFTSYGDMLRVPGSNQDLFSLRASGAQVRVVYSPLDAVKIAQENPENQVVFFAIGFETTAPANIASVVQAKALGIRNFSILSSMVRVPPAIHAILNAPHNRVQGFLAAGHVCAIMGYWEYSTIAENYKIPITVTGFEPVDLLYGILMTIKQLEAGRMEQNQAQPPTPPLDTRFDRLNSDWYFDKLAQVLMFIGGISVIVFIVGIFVFVTIEGFGFLTGQFEFSEFFFSPDWRPTSQTKETYGILALMAGTASVTGFAMLVAIPFSLGAAIYSAEFSSGKTREFLKITVELLAAIPSVVWGFIGLAIMNTVGVRPCGMTWSRAATP